MGRGLVVSPPVKDQDGRLFFKSTDLEREHLRFALLFFDKLAFPMNYTIHIGASKEVTFLESIKIMLRPRVDINKFLETGCTTWEAYSRAHIEAFFDLERDAPGAWAIDQGEHSMQFHERFDPERRAILVELLRAVPIPKKETPLADILDFKEKRKDELLNFRIEIDTLYQNITRSVDVNHSIYSSKIRIEKACADLLAVANERSIVSRLGDMRMTYDFPIGYTLLGASMGTLAEGIMGLPMAISSAVGGIAGAASGLKLSTTMGSVGMRSRSNPFSYVVSMQSELG